MKLKEDIRPVTYMKERAADLLEQVNTTRRPVIITQNGEPRAVVQDPESYERMRNTLAMLKLVAIGEAEIRSGKTYPHAEVMRDLRKRLAKRRAKAA